MDEPLFSALFNQGFMDMRFFRIIRSGLALGMILGFAAPAPILAALSSSIVWQVQSNGSDSNAGGFRGGSTLAVPSAPTVSKTSGGSVAVNTYYFVITRMEGLFETAKSAETSITTDATNKTIVITAPTTATNQTTYWVYGGTTSGGPYFSQTSGNGVANGTNLTLTSTPATTGTQAPGVDYSMQTSAQVVVDNAAITCTTTGANSNTLTFTAGYTPTSADVGNIFRTTAGTNINVGSFEVTGFTSTTWTVAGTSNLTTAGGAGSNVVGVMGGALASPGQAATLAGNKNTVFVKAATYSVTSTANGSGGRVNDTVGCSWIGYDTNRYPYNTDTRPTLAPNANSITPMTIGSGGNTTNIINNFIFDNGSNTGGTGFNGTTGGPYVLWNCKSIGFTTGMAGNSKWTFGLCETVDFTSIGFNLSDQTAIYCTARTTLSGANAALGFSVAGSNFAQVINCACRIDGTHSGSSSCFGGGNAGFFINCSGSNTSTGSGASCFGPTSQRQLSSFINCVGWMVNASSSGPYEYAKGGSFPSNFGALVNCAGHAAGSGGYNNNWTAGEVTGYVAISADPFTNRSGLDYSLNGNAVGGALLKGVGLPGSAAATKLPGFSTNSYPDLGAAQTSSTSLQGKKAGPGGGKVGALIPNPFEPIPYRITRRAG